MKLKDIPDAIRKARTALVERWLRARSPEERSRIIQSAPKSSIVQRVVARLHSDDIEMIHAKEIHAKEIEIAALSRQVADAQAQYNVALVECESVKARVIALKQRHEDIIREQAMAPERAAAIVAALGFDLTGRSEILKGNQTPKLKNHATKQ